MDRRQIPDAIPTFDMELAKLSKLSSSEPQARHNTQYPTLDFSYYNSSPSQGAQPTSTPFLSGAVRNGSKRIRVSGQNRGTPAPSVEKIGSGTESCTSITSSNSELYIGALEAEVNGKPAAPETEQDPPEISDDEDDEEKENEVSDRSYEESESDPSEVLGSNVFHLILSFLDCNSLARCLAVSAAWQRCAGDEALWDAACKQLWEGKIHIHPAALDPSTPRLRAFQISLAESKRIRVEPRDLCTFVWELRFKEHTGEYWKQLDPYYRGLPLMRRVFHTDGYITAEPMDQIWGGHESSWTLRRSKSKRGPPLVRINHWPPLTISRTPAWGWKLENPWLVYASTSERVTCSTPEATLGSGPS